jgi:hypothetical protein
VRKGRARRGEGRGGVKWGKGGGAWWLGSEPLGVGRGETLKVAATTLAFMTVRARLQNCGVDTGAIHLFSFSAESSTSLSGHPRCVHCIKALYILFTVLGHEPSYF